MEHYVDPNSGAAPQPGGYAGLEAGEKGFAIAGEPAKDFSPSEYDAGVQSAVDPSQEPSQNKEQNLSEKERQARLLEAQTNPDKVLYEEDESGNTPAPAEAGSDAQAVENAEIERQAHDPNEVGASEESETPVGAEQQGAQDAAVQTQGADKPYDPSAHGVNEVNAYLAENPDQRDAVVAAERDGKNRKGITGDE